VHVSKTAPPEQLVCALLVFSHVFPLCAELSSS
jgi:hypothetical protein